ncbi:glycerate kinase [uncultured Pseudokineococcus sp.]|uniref:glycerate kinase n=1 Tax=uncultured Pseudokineococcus sp. TaxID=1642928 RepID=UPI002606C31E|nr:glycerate kinase [uncultured Pseudokineococcus sp.]
MSARTSGGPRPLRVVVAVDSFKGSLSTREAGEAVAAGVRAADPTADVAVVPVADGGEGTAECLADAWGARLRESATTDALGRPCTAAWALSPDGSTAVVEIASASGLPGVADLPARPREATTLGTGALLVEALDAGAQEVVLCLGGSATTDGGAGLLAALGARFLDDAGADLPPGGGALARLARVDLSGLHPRARGVRWRLACDVTNPLLGPRGAAAVYGPQKGADADDVAALDDGLARLARALEEATGTAVADLPGCGAAGGAPACLVAVCGAQLEPGAPLVLGEAGLPQLLARGADLVLTGEGSCDAQSLQGKVVDGVAAAVRAEPASAAAAVVVLAGRVDAPAADLAAAGVHAAFSIAQGAAPLADLQRDAAELLADLAERVTRLVVRSSGPGRPAGA